MKKTQLFVMTIILTFIGFLIGNVTGIVITLRNVNNEAQQDTAVDVVITPSTIVERIQKRSFLVTNTVISEESTQIVVDYNSAWSNFWWGKTVIAKANVQTNIGIDLTKISSDNIRVNNADKTITIDLPEPEVFNATIDSDIELTSNVGLLKKLFPDEPTDDYNLAKDQLTEQAKTNIGSSTTYTSSAQENAADTLSFLLSSFEYEVRFEVE